MPKESWYTTASNTELWVGPPLAERQYLTSGDIHAAVARGWGGGGGKASAGTAQMLRYTKHLWLKHRSMRELLLVVNTAVLDDAWALKFSLNYRTRAESTKREILRVFRQHHGLVRRKKTHSADPSSGLFRKNRRV
jgi:hypothetical protein